MNSIRMAQPGDEPRLAQLMQDTGLATPGVDYSVWTQPVIVYEVNGYIVGFIQGIISKPCSIAGQLAVDRHWQNQNIGWILGDALEAVFKQQGIKEYFCFAEPHRTKLLRSYANRNMIKINDLSQYMRRIDA